MSDKRVRRLFLAVAFLTLAVYLVSARGLPQTFDEQVMLDTTQSLVHAKPTINPPLLSQFPDLAVTRPDGKHAAIYGLGNSIASAPLYVVGRVVAQFSPPAKRARVVTTAMMFTNGLLTAVTVFMLMLLCRLLGAPPSGSVLVGLSFGLGSYAFPHAISFFSEPGTALCVLSAAYFGIRAGRSGNRSDLLACGALAGAALIFRISAGLFLPVIGVWLLAAGVRERNVRRSFRFGAWYTAGALGPLVLLLAINKWRYGTFTNLGYKLGRVHQKYPILRGIAGQWLSSGKSLFLYLPIAFVVVLGLWRSFRKLPLDMSLLGAIVVINTVFFARFQFWSGDWAWGPRYLQIVVPCVAAMAAPLTSSRMWRRAVLVLGVLGFLFAALPAVAVRFTLVFYAAYQAMPPLSFRGPRVWDHSYYALVWHTLHWQPILYQLRLLPHAVSNSFDHVTNRFGPAPVTSIQRAPRLEFWWLRARDLGWTTVALFAFAPAASAFVGVRLLRGSRAPVVDGSGDL